MAIGKWIGGVLGWVITGNVLGAMAGFFLGSFFDGSSNTVNTGYGQSGYGGSDGYGGTNAYDEGNRNSFLFSMLVLSSYIIRADGKIMHSEMEFVRDFLRRNFGEIAVSEGETILLRLFEEQKRQGDAVFKENIRQACAEMRMHMDYSTRLQLLSFLAMIAKADGTVSPEEVQAVREIGSYLQIDAVDVESILSMGYSSGRGSERMRGGSKVNELSQAYKILGISPSASNDEVKKAYRQMALKHHPDRVATLGDDVKQAAEKKFQEINNAKEVIFKARGM
ncbi:MAG: TerB family tellurite resistance protein [Prevotella sp.]|nr:TerB family tellurite resistance protein [Prevotella sp.]MBR7048334.1 TerB family tellurite resistance protein [Prevotella sp.]